MTESCPVTATYVGGGRRWTYWCDKQAGHTGAHHCNGTRWTQPNELVSEPARSSR